MIFSEQVKCLTGISENKIIFGMRVPTLVKSADAAVCGVLERYGGRAAFYGSVALIIASAGELIPVRQILDLTHEVKILDETRTHSTFESFNPNNSLEVPLHQVPSIKER